MKRPGFDSIKTYEEFNKFKWTRNELVCICKEHGLKYRGTEEKLHKVIKAYFNGVKIPPNRDWYSNMVLNCFVNDNGVAEVSCCFFLYIFILTPFKSNSCNCFQKV